MWSITGTVVFSVAYSLVVAVIATKFKINLALLMVNYGFGFSTVSIFLVLEWGKIPSFSPELVQAYPLLWIVAAIAVIGFLVSAYLVLIASPTS